MGSIEFTAGFLLSAEGRWLATTYVTCDAITNFLSTYIATPEDNGDRIGDSIATL
jgi:hypothetical protein